MLRTRRNPSRTPAFEHDAAQDATVLAARRAAYRRVLGWLFNDGPRDGDLNPDPPSPETATPPAPRPEADGAMTAVLMPDPDADSVLSGQEASRGQ